jgi:hypothetical protein
METYRARVAREERARVQRVATKTRLAYTSSTGDMPRVERKPQSFGERVANCADLAKYGEHVLAHVEADLPGDRSVGSCTCGQYIDTGTFNERNA